MWFDHGFCVWFCLGLYYFCMVILCTHGLLFLRGFILALYGLVHGFVWLYIDFRWFYMVAVLLWYDPHMVFIWFSYGSRMLLYGFLFGFRVVCIWFLHVLYVSAWVI